jgi:flagellar hook-associated protein 2 C-terminal domain protein
MAIRMSGMISGLDTESIVKSLMETQQAKKTKIESKKQKLEWKQEIWSGLNTKMYSFYKDYAGKLRFQSNYQTKKATSSDSTKVTVSANSSATKGTYRVNVKSLAAAQYVTSAKISSYETTNDQGEKVTNKVTSSTKLSDLGMTADGTKQIQIKTADQTVSMTVNADTTISDFVDNLKSAGLNASFDEGQGRFFIGAKDSGLDQKFEIKMTAFTQEQLNAQQTVNNAVKYDSLTAAQKNSVLDVLDSIQNDTSSDKIDSAVASLMEVSDAQAKSEVTGYYRNQIVTELETKYFKKDENGNNVITDDAKQALINAGKLEEKDDASHTQEELVTLAKQYIQENADSQIAGDDYQSKITEALTNGLSNDEITIQSEETRKRTITDAVTDYATAMAKGAGVEAGSSAELQKIGLDTIDGSAVQESASGVGMVVVAAADSVVQVNGATLTSSKTSLNVNGLSLDLMDVTDGEVSITVSDDTDAVYDSIKEFVTQYNSILKEMNTLYNAESARNYDVLTDDQKDAMSDEEVEKWNTKIKDSLLRRDSTLDGLITTMRSITGKSITASNGKKYSLANLGITTGTDYKEYGQLHIKGDEDDSVYSDSTNTLQDLLKEDPDVVAEVMAGLTNNLYDALNEKMKSTTMSSALTFYNDKEMTKQMTQYKKDIKSWETKLQTMEDHYYKQFSAMEKALASLNSQQSSLSSYLGSN